MPELDLPDLHLPEAGLYLAAAMLYPREPSRHWTLIESARNAAVKRILSRTDPERIPRPAIPLIVAAATGVSLDDEVARTQGHLVAAAGYARPDIAAVVFVYVLACAASSQKGEPATLEHAREMILTAGGARASLPGLGRSYLIDIWRDFSPAVHLLAAKFFFPDLWNHGSRGGARLAEFLAHAEAMRLLGEGHRPARSKTALLDSTETWRIPERFVLPRVRLELPTPCMIKAQMAQWCQRSTEL